MHSTRNPPAEDAPFPIHYLKRVVERIEHLLASDTRLPCPFKIAKVWVPQTDWRATFFVEPVTPLEGIFETQDVFIDIMKKLESEFKNEPLYFGIDVAPPHEFLGRSHVAKVLEQQRQQEEDKKLHRHIRLKDIEK